MTSIRPLRDCCWRYACRRALQCIRFIRQVAPRGDVATLICPAPCSRLARMLLLHHASSSASKSGGRARRGGDNNAAESIRRRRRRRQQPTANGGVGGRITRSFVCGRISMCFTTACPMMWLYRHICRRLSISNNQPPKPTSMCCRPPEFAAALVLVPRLLTLLANSKPCGFRASSLAPHLTPPCVVLPYVASLPEGGERAC